MEIKYIIENSALYNSDKTQLIAFPPAAPNTLFALPEGVKTIRQCALLGCHILQEILIPDNSVTQIGLRAFENCTSLKHINIPQCITDIGPNAFNGCNHLSCGINVQNQTAEYITKLINAKFPLRSLKSCKCTHANKYSQSMFRYYCSIFTILGSS